MGRALIPTLPQVEVVMHSRRLLGTFLALMTFGLSWSSVHAQDGEWKSLFNGKDLEGWTPKITGQKLGDDPYKTFRVEDGVLKVRYDNYPEFKGQFGHLFYKESFSKYKLRLEYRFVGQQVKGGPGWAIRNSGVMIHGQSPETMRVDQEFPVSIEVQYLGGDGKNPRPTGNLCTPGTHVVMDGKLLTRHCTNSRSKTYHGDAWVRSEVIAMGGGRIEHYIDGQKVLEYEQAQYDDKDPDGKVLLQKADGKRIIPGGYLSLQAESHPVEFRRIEIQRLQD